MKIEKVKWEKLGKGCYTITLNNILLFVQKFGNIWEAEVFGKEKREFSKMADAKLWAMEQAC